jgi:hypothetical protein
VSGPWNRRLALGAPFVLLPLFAARFMRLGVAEKMSYVPDDAFYYMELGSEYQRSGRWSFDRGRTMTSGFHPLFGYLSALVERALPSRSDAALDARFCLHAALATLVTLTALALLAGAARRAFPRGTLAAMLFVGSAGGVFLLPMQAMEWPYAVLGGALVARALVARRAAWLTAAIVLGCLARTDFVIAGGCAAVAIYSTDRRLADRATRARLLAAAVGVAAGALAVTLHAWSASGHFVQSSARMKAHWGAVVGYQPLYGLEPASYAFSPAFVLTRTLDLGPATLVPLAIAVAALAWSTRAGSARREGEPGREGELADARALWRWGALTAVAYPLVYGKIGTAAQCWYSAHFVPALFVVVAAVVHRAGERLRHVLVAAGALLAVVNVWDARRPPWNASDVLARARALADDGAIGVAASWNAGTRGFLGGEKVVNIDGLVNDDVYPYVVRDRLHCYLVQERIPFIVDDAAWPTPLRARYLGFANGALLHAMKRVDDGSGVGGGAQAVWAIDLAELARDPACADDLLPARRPHW